MAAGPELSQVVFRLFSSKEIRDLSVVEIKTSLCFNALDHPLKDGLYDLIMGPSGSTMETCGTCKQTTRYCPGHFGHIELPLPVVNPLFHKEIATLLKISCSNCFKIIMEPHLQYLLMYQLKLLDAGYIVEAQELETFVLNMEKEKTPDAALGELIKEQIIKRLDGIDFNRPPEKSAKTTESLRRQFIHNVMKQMKRPKQCPYCKVNFRKIVSYQNKLLTSVSKVEVADKFRDSADGRKGGPGAAMIFPEESRSMLRKIYLESSELILELYPILKDTGLENPVDMMYMDVVLVTPPKTRPVNYSDGKMIENNHTRSFKAIANDCVITRNVIRAVQENTFDNLTEDCKAYVINIKGKTPTEKLHQCWLELQSDVDHLLDADMNKATGTTGISGMKQIIEKKMGILRMHMMGKRVNYAARSVITPDPNLQVQEIGIPEYFAKRLTYPVRVNHLNVQELREMVKRGPDVYPGATMVEDENGRLIRLFGGDNNQTKRDGVAKMLFRALKNEGTGTKIVHRHVQNGDMLLLNRQPTLHRPSMMAHRARILKGEKTLRMHYSNCKSYNADFDGDEMNAHLPQSELARSECRNIVNVASHYLVPKDGTPLGGLIQDHVISGVRLTIRGKFFNKQDYCQLVFQALSHKVGYIQLLPPTILKPRKLWSGKQIISTILINIIPKEKQRISLNASAKIGVKSWEKEKPRPWKCGTEFKDPKEMSESIVLIRNGELLEGVLDKQHYGATQYGLTHCLFELYGGQCSSSFLDSLGRCFTFNLQLNGFTIGVEDILVLAEPDSVRKEVIEKARKIGNEAAMRALDLEQVPVDLTERLEQLFYQDRAKFRKLLDLEYKKLLEEHTNQINKVCLPTGLVSKFPDNNLQLMVTSGAKGSQVNTMQISCLLGQIELEGQRPPWMISGKSLPSFRPFETAPVAGGYIDGRFMTGINPQDFFFHCMAGREGLIDTAVKTSRSGYLQRCLIKHLEGIMVAYDGTVRDHDGSVVQFAYGEDGLEVQKAVFLNKNQMDFLYENRESVADKANVKILKKSTETKTIKRYKEKLYGNPNLGSKCRITSPFTIFSSDENVRRKIKQKYWEDFNKDTGRIKAYLKLHKKWKKLSEEKRENYKVEQCLDPVTSKFRPHSDFGVITEKLEDLIKGYLETRSGRKKEIASVEKKKIVEVEEAKKEHVKDLINMKYMFSLCQPGEPVGLLAAQSVGEPSTQMTLNTFHFAGRGEMNVTLGIPRLREILMTAAKNIKTPNMDIPLMPTKAGNLEKRVKKLKKEFRRVTISDVLEKITVDEKLELAPTRIFTYTVRFDFLPHNCYKQEFNTNPSNILKFMEKDFLIGLSKEVRKLGKKYGDIIYESKGEKEMTKPEDEGEADNVDAAGIELRGNAQGFGEDHESSDEDGEMDDDDATKAKLRDRHEENRDYDEPEESEVEQSDEENEEETEESEEKTQRSDEEIEEEEMMTEEERKDVERRQKAVLGTFQIVKSYRYDVAKEEWCEIVIGIPLTLSKIDFSTILKELCKKAVVYEIPNIKRAFAYEKNGTMMIQTDGINFIELFNLMQKYPKYFDVNKISSNDVYQVSQTYGIEAAVRVIVKELSNVFGVYGITVDHRHLSLIADYMTQQGTYSPFNRTGMLDNPSPFQQMTFESSVNFLKRALFDSKRDDLQSPSSRIMVGRFCASGTGCFDVINDPKSFESETRNDKFKSKLKIKSEEEM